MKTTEIRTANVTHYMQPLREGGSLPAIVKADDDFQYVLKFRGAGQGTKALIAELIGGELARQIGLNVPEMVFLYLDEAFGRTEPDEEIQDLLKFSVGQNLGLHYLSGSITFDPLVQDTDPLLSSKVLLLDCIINNIDRTPKNTNLLYWNRELWLIDHGASMYFHHNWNNWESGIDKILPNLKEHVLLNRATALEKAANIILEKWDEAYVREVVGLIPDNWLVEEGIDMTPSEKKTAYMQFLNERIKNMDRFIQSIDDARG